MQLHGINFEDARLMEFCRRNSVAELLVFGSITREDFSPASDIDVIVKFGSPERHSILDLGRMQHELVELFGRAVHLHTLDMLHPYLRERILQSAKVAYAA